MMTLSFGVHAAVVIGLFILPQEWFSRVKSETITMSISMGSPGERTGGLTAAGGRPVEQVAPPPTRPAPILPAAPKETAAIATKTAKPAPVPTPNATTAPPRPPTTGAQVQQGTAAAATGAVGQGRGLSIGGGAGGTSAVVDESFCCPEYIKEQLRRIQDSWARYRNQPEAGETTLVFEIHRDGTITKPIVEKSGGVLLDIASQAAMSNIRLQALPEKFIGESLKIHLTFPYVR